MNRNVRKYGRLTKKNESEEKRHELKSKSKDTKTIEEVLPPKERRNSFKADKLATNRCCYISPVLKDVCLSTECQPLNNQYENLVAQYNLDPVIPDTIKQLDELKKVLCRGTKKVEKSSQYLCPNESMPSFIEIADGSHWQNVDNADELEHFIIAENEVINTVKSHLSNTKPIHISEEPRVKVIAEKFCKFKKNNLELRKLEEKIVCIEYDVFKDDVKDLESPVQKMRAYFTVRPTDIINKGNEILVFPSTIKNKFNITDEDLGNLNEKEIEIIDGKMSENQPYLDDLKKVLKRKRAIYAKKNKSTLDLMSLYEMAKRDSPAFDEDFSDTNLLSKAELKEIKSLIFKKSASSKHGISKRTVKSEKETIGAKRDSNNTNIISESIFAELLRN